MIIKLLEFVPLIVKACVGKNVTEEARAVTGEDQKPYMLHRRTIGLLAFAFSGWAAAYFGLPKMDEVTVEALVDNVYQLIPIVGAIYSSIVGYVGTVRAGK